MGVGGPRPGGECGPGHQDHPVEEQAWGYYLGSEYYQDQNIIRINILFKKSKPENTDKCISSLRNLFGRFRDFSLVSHARVHSNQPKLFNSSLPLMFLPNSLKYENFSAYSFDPSEFQPGKENRTKTWHPIFNVNFVESMLCFYNVTEKRFTNQFSLFPANWMPESFAEQRRWLDL